MARRPWGGGVAALLTMAACSDEIIRPQPQALELRITGATRSYVSGTASFGTTVVGLAESGTGLRGAFGPITPTTETVVLDLLTDGPQLSDGQTTTTFDRFVVGLHLTPGIVEIDVGRLPDPELLVSLRRAGSTVLLVDDPCVLDVRFDTDTPSADADRALYGSSLEDLLLFTFARSDAYDGGNVFEDGEDRTEFQQYCASDAWGLADMVACLNPGGGLVCFFHA